MALSLSLFILVLALLRCQASLQPLPHGGQIQPSAPSSIQHPLFRGQVNTPFSLPSPPQTYLRPPFLPLQANHGFQTHLQPLIQRDWNVHSSKRNQGRDDIRDENEDRPSRIRRRVNLDWDYDRTPGSRTTDSAFGGMFLDHQVSKAVRDSMRDDDFRNIKTTISDRLYSRFQNEPKPLPYVPNNDWASMLHSPSQNIPNFPPPVPSTVPSSVFDMKKPFDFGLTHTYENPLIGPAFTITRGDLNYKHQIARNHFLNFGAGVEHIKPNGYPGQRKYDFDVSHYWKPNKNIPAYVKTGVSGGTHDPLTGFIGVVIPRRR